MGLFMVNTVSTLLTSKPLQITMLEANCGLRHLRPIRNKLHKDLLLMEERIRAGENGSVTEAHRVMDAEISTLDEMIRKLWEVYTSFS